MNKTIHWLHGFIPKPTAINNLERLRACSGALFGILLTGLVARWLYGATAPLPLLVAPMGASAVLLFALPSSPLAQPWALIGGNLVSAALGVTCAQWINDPMLAASLAVAASIGAMMVLRCVHPPSGAVALTAVLGGPLIHAEGYRFVLAPIGINSLLLLAVALIFNNLTKHVYPHRVIEHGNTHRTADRQSNERLGFTSTDLDYVLTQYNQILDVSRDDLESLLIQTEMHAYRRRFGEITCADIMSRDVISVEFSTDLQHAWELLHRHNIKALPVIDPARRVIGIVTLVDFMQHAGLDRYQNFATKMRQFLRHVGRAHSEQPEVIGQIMTPVVHTAFDSMHITELVDLFSHKGLRHIPIINAEHHLVGMVTNSDLVAGLYRGRLGDMDQ
ncbi:HPP family protein [Solimicrobium silvestre]|uniref:CBS-domain-containing membrane protein n=1 Tax=Solimicrobium silvestre TaxID=2099400 RepID=A0A2S9GZQ4_9BURK|nr:HPP family protein [Solimicrobium silvestre]PRC93183.1 CBS-domain-containing membrane protein [Solimicrobium silvestre]